MVKMLVAMGAILLAIGLPGVPEVASSASDVLSLLVGNSHTHYRVVPNGSGGLVSAAVAAIGVLFLVAGVFIHRRRVKR